MCSIARQRATAAAQPAPFGSHLLLNASSSLCLAPSMFAAARPLVYHPLPAPSPHGRQAQSELMARDLTAALQEVESSIQRLPPMAASEAEEVGQAVDLMRQNAEASAELAAELAAARAKLARLQEAHGALAEAALCHRAAAAAAAAADKAAAAAAGKSG